jgi:regulation of enolase protein 1 (concanavalin A-like superfamily)
MPTSCPVFSITGAGGLSAQDDIYAFASRSLAGDGYLVARVSQMTGATSALAGISIRGSLSAGAAQLSLMKTAAGGLVIRKRTQANYPVYQTNVSAPAASWLRLERKGQTISLAHSPDGTQWSVLTGATIQLPTTALIGLVLTSQQPNMTATAVMSNVLLASNVNPIPGWTKVDLGTVTSVVQVNQTSWSMVQWSSATQSGVPSFLYQRVTGDAELSFRLLGLTSDAALGGLMVRSTLAADSPFLWLRASPLGARTVQRRQISGLTPTTATVGKGAIPGWLKIKRQGTLVSSYVSSDGNYWTLMSTDPVELTDSVYLGIAVAGAGGVTAIAAIDNVRVTALSANVLPSVRLTEPSSARSLYAGSALRLAATASDADDRVEAVEFFVDSTRIGIDTVAPYEASWIAAGVGVHQVTAVARDSDGATVRTAPVAVTVLALSGGGSTTGGTSTATQWRLVFTPSLDHDRTVDRYTAEIYATDRWALVGSRDLGRPPVVSGECTVDVTLWIAALPAGQYQIIVRAVDDSTATRSVGVAFNFTR